MSGTVLIVGAGASGMTAAIAAARKGAKVTILEAQDHAGKKLLVTGNGRCNLTNLSDTLPASYRGSGAELAKNLTGKFDAKATLSFFSELGLLSMEKNGWVYPHTMSAGAVLDVLMSEMRRLKVNIKFNQKILRISDHGMSRGDCPRYEIETPSWVYQADAVILSCGSMAAPSTGANEGGYLLAQTLGHTIIKVRPALVPLTLDFPWLNRLSGVRCLARVTLSADQKEIASDRGELQWTKYGVSGIVIFQLSRYLDENSSSCELKIDFLPGFERQELYKLLSGRAKELDSEPVSVLLRGILHEKLIRVILDEAQVPVKSCRELSDSDLEAICRVMKSFPVSVSGTRSFDQAQICAGGVDCREITEKLESRLHPGLFFSGELLDVDGPCGGFNLQWAWSSGYLAGENAALFSMREERGEANGDQ